MNMMALVDEGLGETEYFLLDGGFETAGKSAEEVEDVHEGEV